MKKKEQKKGSDPKRNDSRNDISSFTGGRRMSEKRYLSDRSVGFQYKAGRNTEKYRLEK